MEKALYQMQPQDPQYHVYNQELLPADLDVED